MSLRSAALSTLVLLGCTLAAQAQSLTLLPPDRSVEQVVDHYINAALQEAKVKPVPLTDDASLVRRLTLDLAGRIPTPAETAEYCASTDPAKKVKLIERLLSSPGFVRHQTQEFFTLLGVQDTPGKAPKNSELRDYLLASFNENRPWDRIFRDLLLPENADPKTRGAADFLKSRIKDQNRLTIDVSTLFFGVNISCAQCHDHPHVPAWTQDHFYGMKSFFVRTVEAGGFVGEKDFGFVKYLPNKGQEKVAPVMFLTGTKIDAPGLKEPSNEEKKKEQERLGKLKKGEKGSTPPPPPQFSLRAKFVETALAPSERHYFARAIVNRLWHRFFARGLVMPLDQMHVENPATHPELLAWLARDVAEHGYDLKRLIRGLVLSDAYARSSRWEGDKLPDERLFAVAQVRALAPTQMAVSLKLASADPNAWPSNPAEFEKRLEALEKSAARLAALFPQPGDQFQVGVSEAMLFTNNQDLLKELLEGPGTLAARLLEVPELEKRAELAVRAVLSRQPRADEIQALTAYLRARQDRPAAACQQIVWALLTSAEFRFNH